MSIQQAVLLGGGLQKMEGKEDVALVTFRFPLLPALLLGSCVPCLPPTTRLWAACLERAVHHLLLECAAAAHYDTEMQLGGEGWGRT